jgi:SPP1 family predicted phage head-tail adaptor
VSAADLRARVRLERPQRAADDIGGGAITWMFVAEVWAAIESRPGGIAERFDGASSTTTHTIEIRARADVRPGWRVAIGARVLRIVAVAASDPAGARLTLACEEERS